MLRFLCSLAVCAVALPAFAADFAVSASGRCVYKEGGVAKPIAGAQVELRDQDFGIPISADVVGPMALDVSGNDVCARGVTDTHGRFALSGRCGDVGPCLFGSCPKWARPDLYVRCSLNGRAGRVFRNKFPFTLYNATSHPRSDSSAALAAGDVELPAGAAKTFLSMTYTHDVIKAKIGTSLFDVWALYPGGREAKVLNTDDTYFASFAGTLFMSIAPGDEANGTVGHEYHHTLQFQAFVKDWSKIQSVVNALRAGYESIRNSSGAGHTLTTKSNPVMAFAEGWAEFGEEVVYGSGLPDCATWKEIGGSELDKISVEGNVACRLMRLYTKWGYRDIWRALASSKAVRYDHWFADFVKLHPDAAGVALPKPDLIALPLKLGTVRLLSLQAAKTTQLATSARAPTESAAVFAASERLPSVAIPFLRQAEGPACGAIRDGYALQLKYVQAACQPRSSAEAARDCDAKARTLAASSHTLSRFCSRLSPRLLRVDRQLVMPVELRAPLLIRR